jgi:DNA polymerase/3'-5' exonuclease PolX
MIFPWKCLEKKIMKRFDSKLQHPRSSELQGFSSCFDLRFRKEKERIKTWCVLSCLLPLDRKDHIESFPRSKERHTSFKGEVYRDREDLKSIDLVLFLSPSHSLVSFFLSHQNCSLASWLIQVIFIYSCA